MTSPDAAAPVTEPPATQAPKLGKKGLWLWREATKDGALTPLTEALLLETCRLADRLDKLDEQLRGDGPWLELNQTPGSHTFVVVVNDALKEARAEAIAFKQLATELRQTMSGGRGRGGKPRGGERKPESGSKGGSVADLTARIAQMRSQTSG